MLSGIPESAMCVQRFDDSLNSAIHITYRISLRSSSLREPRDPLSKVVYTFYNFIQDSLDSKFKLVSLFSKNITKDENSSHSVKGLKPICNDPTAGSPTVTLLRLVLPLNDQV
jgi:hypothetical protein